MTKLQPSFSFQKYLDNPQDQAEQFQRQLQSMHLNTSNAVNATIDDMSYFLQNRPTGETWIDGYQIQTVTITGTIAAGPNSYSIGATILNLVSISGVMQDTVPITAQANPLPFVNAAGNNVGIWATPTTVVIDPFDATWVGYTFYITLKYTIKRG
jgi:hypothetical protein